MTDISLSKLKIKGCEYLNDEEYNQNVFHVDSVHALIQAAGYLKFNIAKIKSKGVFFRGQTELYDSLKPSIFRKMSIGSNSIIRRRKLINDYLGEIDKNGNVLKSVDINCREALLQHYGINTTWLDVVDNIWIALWFSCYESKYTGKYNEYLHFEKRVSKTQEKYAYILLIESAYFAYKTSINGYYKDERSETVDLRVAVPSYFIRPHAQHGILVRKISKSGIPTDNCMSMLVGIIRVNLSSAIDWLGFGTSLLTHSLFPPTYYDAGYLELLENIHRSHRQIGAINYVNA